MGVARASSEGPAHLLTGASVAKARGKYKGVGEKSWEKVEPVGEAFYRAFCLAERFLEALCLVRSRCRALGARTGRALQDCSALSRWRSKCFAICCRTGAQAAQPLAKRARPRLSHHWCHIGFARRHPLPKAPRPWIAFALPSGRAHAVLQCAPRARTKG